MSYGFVDRVLPASILASSGTLDHTPPKITGVTISGITGTSATVIWVTDEPASTQVEYGRDMAFGSTTPRSATRMTTHTVTIRLLESGVTYHFRVKSIDARGNSATSDAQAFDTHLVETVPEYLTSEDGSIIVGSDGKQIVLYNNEQAVDVTWEELKQFLQDDKTDELPYVRGTFVCGEFAKTLHDNAEKAGIRAAFVTLDFNNDPSGHAVNAFDTTDGGLVYIDDTGDIASQTCSWDKTLEVEVGRSCTAKFIFSCPSIKLVPLGTVSDYEVFW